MLDKSYLKEIIQNSFPDIANTKFSLNNTPVSHFTENSLLPFLVYQNTIDVHHRLIGLYLPQNCSIINLIPFYVMMGQFRKALDTVMQAKNYQNQSFGSNEKQVVFNGDICNISSIDFINRRLIFRSGRGRVINLPFLESYKIKWSNNARDIEKKVESFEEIDRAGSGNIFSFPISPRDNLYEGVIIFTNTSKFESLLRSVEISGTDLREHMNIQKVVFPSKDEDIRFTRLSKPQTSKKPVSLIIARHDAFRSYKSIIDAGAGSLNHIRTIIIDDFDELVSRWEKSDCVKEEVGWLNDNYFKRIHEKQIKDLYLISRNSNVHIHQILKETQVSYNPWLLNPLEEQFINSEKDPGFAPVITVTNIGDSHFENLACSLNILINKWKELARNSFCNGEILSPINNLYELRKKLNSFFNSEILFDFTETFLLNLDQLQKKWFSARQDYNTIEETKKFVLENFNADSRLVNFKLLTILEILKDMFTKGIIFIVSENNTADDIKWLKDEIHATYPEVTVNYFHKKDFLCLNQDYPASNCIIFYLTSDKKIIGRASGNVLAKEQVFILNDRSYSFTETFLKKNQRLQIEVGNTNKKYQLLNIKESPDSSLLGEGGLIPLHFIRHQIGLFEAKDEPSIPEEELQDVVEHILQKQQHNSWVPTERFLLFFDDGSIMHVPESKHFFLYEDDKETDDFEKSLRTAEELCAGDEVILAKRGWQLKEILEQALKKNKDFSQAIEMDYKWRLLIRNHIERCNWPIDYFRRKLQQNDFSIGSDLTIRNWIDGETRRPDNFLGLLTALSNLNIIHKEEIKDFDRYNSEIKSIQSRFVRTAIRELIARLNGINIEEDDVFTEDLLNDFINHIEIKRISTIYKL
jgi:hypothetical protein